MVLKGSVNPAGYKHYRLMGKDGNTKTIGEHRLLAMTYMDKPDNYQCLVVNHLDGDKSNNAVHNFEWTSYQGNVHHAGQMGLTEKCIPIQTKCVITNLVKTYPSYISAALDLGITKDAISWRVNNGEDKVDELNLQYRKARDDINWAFPTAWDKAILMRNVLTGEVKEYSEQTRACEEYGVSPGFISKQKVRIGQPLFAINNELFQMIPYSPNPKWVDYADPYLEYEKSGNRRCVVMYKPAEEERRIFLSPLLAAEAYNLKKSTVQQRLAKGTRNIWFDGFICHYLF